MREPPALSCVVRNGFHNRLIYFTYISERYISGEMYMKKAFLIIGLTGAIGSGCSEIAKFISNISQNKQSIKTNLDDIEVSIRKHFEYLKEKTTSFSQNLNSRDTGPYTGTNIEELFAQKSISQESRELEEKLKSINKNLRELLIRRKILQYALVQLDKKFYQISMANLLVKLMLENFENKESKEFLSQEKTPICIKEILKKHSENLLNTIKDFNISCKNKKWETKDYKRFDEMILELDKIRSELFTSSDSCEEFFQDAGDNARATKNPFNSNKSKGFENISILAKEANKIIKYIRNKGEKANNKTNYFVINSFRNPGEVQFFRKRYGSFYLCSLYASKETRRKNLLNYNKIFNEDCDDRDAGKNKKAHELHKQDVPRCTLLADYAITTEKDKKHYQYESIRFLSLIDSPGIVPPRTDEEVMNLAYSLSLRSTCLSRQVGAVITNPEGFIIAAGWNSVGSGQLGCSQVCLSDYKKFSDNGYLLSNWREYISNFEEAGLFEGNESDYFCFKDLQSKLFLSQKFDKAQKELNDSSENDKNAPDCSNLKRKISIKRLEYARALHAEENAILQAARFGGTGIAGGTIYTTTYPCELCSKKIYQSQLNRIVYTEPYPDSLSETIFLKDGIRQISIEQFEGVKSPSFFRLFKPEFDLKEDPTVVAPRR